jgi:hypothetical protein
MLFWALFFLVKKIGVLRGNSLQRLHPVGDLDLLASNGHAARNKAIALLVVQPQAPTQTLDDVNPRVLFVTERDKVDAGQANPFLDGADFFLQ